MCGDDYHNWATLQNNIRERTAAIEAADEGVDLVASRWTSSLTWSTERDVELPNGTIQRLFKWPEYITKQRAVSQQQWQGLGVVAYSPAASFTYASRSMWYNDTTEEKLVRAQASAGVESVLMAFGAGGAKCQRSAAIVRSMDIHIGASGKGRENLINPLGRRDRCIAGVCAVVRNKLAREFLGSQEEVEQIFGYVGRGRNIQRPEALEYIQNATGLQASDKPIPFNAKNAPVGHYVIFGGRPGALQHVVYGRVLPNGKKVIFDPQIGKQITWDDLVNQYGGGYPFLLESGD